MARGKKKPVKSGNNGNDLQHYTKLENRLVLLAWLHSLFGYQSNSEALADCKKVEKGFREDGRSFLYYHLIARGSQVKITAEDLEVYDENIRRHLERINKHRKEEITLLYFQYLAALYTEIFLHRFFTAKNKLLGELNEFVKKRKDQLSANQPPYERFTEDDLNKLAYWMATGSGKTIILHLNYLQFLHYYNLGHKHEPLDNILLITPNAGLTEQHLRELQASGIPARRFDPNQGSQRGLDQNEVQVIEITKLAEEKRGEGVSVPVEAFEGRNLIFVDEGHKGSGGEAWRKYRDALGKTGFTFEYSATFGQALSAAGNDSLTAEYSKAIIFDYSYKYFYGDGFGKDFRILNLKKQTEDSQTHTLLLGNLLSFYEQVRLYEEHREELEPYNLERPLWIFVGSTVNAVYKEQGKKKQGKPRSDVLTVVEFFNRFLRDSNWAEKGIENLLQGKSGLNTPEGEDVFAESFPFLRQLEEDAPKLYQDILKRVFHAQAGGGLHLAEFRNSPGELGLKAANAQDYFGLIYIGDTDAFKKLLLEEKEITIPLKQDHIADSLFERINLKDSKLHVLIGAKKFIEGWNSWRVASMGLLNVGKREGSQIIQLFGRGVRLKGKDMSLKRSAFLGGEHPPFIQLLETLNVFAVRADYMAQFRTYLEREGVEPAYKEFRLPVRLHLPKGVGLVLPRPGEGREFTREKALVLSVDESIPVKLDLSAQVELIVGGPGETEGAGRRPEKGRPIPTESLELVDWQEVYLQVLAHKARKGFSNLVIRPQVLREIITSPRVTLRADPDVLEPKSFGQRNLLQRAVTQLLCSYVDRFYQKHREKWEEETLVYKYLDAEDPNLTFN
ncbi:MAG: DEAD/DEAH box helicase family protein, partial [Thermus sp.]|uniref:DEAD/DEAH box helicase family protein n=1 Tax=Thermus sp. TaxID=275 RepID=UPI00391BE2AE